MAKRAIIYNNIEAEIDRMCKLEVTNYKIRYRKALTEVERESLKKPKKPNLN